MRTLSFKVTPMNEENSKCETNGKKFTLNGLMTRKDNTVSKLSIKS